jgi:integrase
MERAEVYGAAPSPVAIDKNLQAFNADAKARHLSAATLSKLKTLTDQLEKFCTKAGVTTTDQLTTDVLRDFRASWEDGAVAALKKFERLRTLCRFLKIPCDLKAPRVKLKPTLPFTAEQMVQIMLACDAFSTNGRYRAKNRTRIRAMVLLLRYSGIRIGDAVTLKRERIDTEGKLLLYTAKTGTPVYIPLPDFVIAALSEVSPFYDDEGKVTGAIFWNGKGKATSAIGVWERTFARLFEIAKIDDGHAHRFRDTFAVGLLQQGVSLEDVSVLLGHSSIRITERHYAPWVKSRQDLLETAVKKVWSKAFEDLL